jgi:hypothetical protein
VPSSGTSSIASNWCRFEMCAVSRSPSIDCTQLHRTSSLFAATIEAGSASVPKSLNGVIVSGGPMYVQTMPPDSRVGYAVILIFCAKGCSSERWSTHWPVTSNFQPW